ncbi:MAG TPA: chorismate mutase [Chondromyces sp.]|nr:chorismate mutase [Chondromyces sp.]
MIRGVRGAVTIENNQEHEMIEATDLLVREMISQNNIKPEDVSSIFISVTEDLDAAFPAKALRKIPGWVYVPVMCMREIPVPGSLPKCIRVMMHVETELAQEKVQHVYLKEAVRLRPDLQQSSGTQMSGQS